MSDATRRVALGDDRGVQSVPGVQVSVWHVHQLRLLARLLHGRRVGYSKMFHRQSVAGPRCGVSRAKARTSHRHERVQEEQGHVQSVWRHSHLFFGLHLRRANNHRHKLVLRIQVHPIFLSSHSNPNRSPQASLEKSLFFIHIHLFTMTFF